MTDNKNAKSITFEGIEYRAIPGFKNYYVSKYGGIYSAYRNRLLTISYNNGSYAYPTISFSIDGKQVCYPLHKAIALAWCPLPKGYSYEDVIYTYKDHILVVDHIDRNKSNFFAGNLRWCTQMENIDNMDRVKKCEKLKGNQNAKGKRNSETHYRYEYIYDGKTYSLKELCAELKCSKSKITESFRKDFGLVKLGRLTRKIKPSKEELKALEIGHKEDLLAREITEAEIEELYRSFKED